MFDCSLNAALNLLGYNDRNATMHAAIQDPALEMVVEKLLQALSGTKCWSKLPPVAKSAKDVWAQMAMFYHVMSENPAGTVLNVLVLAIGVTITYVLVKRLKNRLPVILQSPRVAEYVSAVESFLAALRPNQEVPLLPEVPNTPLPTSPIVSRPPSPVERAAVGPTMPEPPIKSRSVDQISTPSGRSARSSIAAAPTLEAAVSAPHLYPDLAAELANSLDDFQVYRKPARAVSSTDEEVSPKTI